MSVSDLGVLSSEENRIATARRYLDSAELWLRRLIEYEFTKRYGSDYFRDGVIKSSIRSSVEKWKAATPGRFARDIDATSFEQLIEIATNHDNFKNVLSPALINAFPLGAEHLKFQLTKLLYVRNSVQHGNGCTSRQLEQSVCYSNDLSGAIKDHFGRINMGHQYNVPTIVSIKDNKGNRIDRRQMTVLGNQSYVDLRGAPAGNLYHGDDLLINRSRSIFRADDV